tara:strand:+ start:60 stop:668 length:609 start_codon:yes stop_codon:yes gene_type:complete
MSELKTEKLSPRVTSLQLGDSGDTFTVPSGATLDIASGATIDATGATTTGFGGITHASTWKIDTEFTGGSDPITTNWTEESGAGYGTLGTSMTESSGVFSFPTTGFWLIQFIASFSINSASSRYCNAIIQTTPDDSTYTTIRARSNLYNSGGWTYGFAVNHFLMDVTSTSTHKVRFATVVDNANTYTKADETRATFVRLADT